MSASPALPHLRTALSYLATDFSTRKIAHQSRSTYRNADYVLATKQPNASLVQTIGDSVLIKAVSKVAGSSGLNKQLAAIGGTILSRYGRVVTAAVPVSAVAKVNGLTYLRYADLSYAPITQAGKTEDYGAQAITASSASKQYSVDGTGVTVGILSDSYDQVTTDATNAADDVASGDLPSNVNVLKEGPTVAQANVGDEGRAMAQIVHDVAPGAGIAFYTAYDGEADFANGILQLAKPVSSGGAGAKVIVDDVTYLDEPFFQDGIIAQAVNTANATYGVSYFSAAGNESRQSYESAFRSVSTTVAGVGAGTFQNFNSSGGTQAYQTVTIPAGAEFLISLQWDSPFLSASSAAGGSAGASNSLSAYLINASNNSTLSAETSDVVGTDAYQILDYTNNTGSAITAKLAVKLADGAAPGVLKYINYGSSSITTDWATNGSTAVGHANTSGGLGVAAAYYGNTPAFGTSPAVKETYSSAGGASIYFNANGTRKASAEVRNQPAITSVDGAATTFFAQQFTTVDGQWRFFGTSAAAPHAAAVAALLLQAKPSLSASQVYSTLETTALDMGTAGFDYDNGYGLIQADKALASIASGSISGVSFRDLNRNGVKDGSDTAVAGSTVFLDSNNNGVADSGTSTVSSSSSMAIPDATATYNAPSRATSTINVSTLTGRVTSVTVTIDETHAHQGDIGLTLITPSGIRIPLLSNLGNISAGGTGINLTLSDAATTYIQSVYNPSGVLTGTYKPQSALSAAIGESANGAWQLEARDYQSTNAGTLNSWSLTINYADPTTTTDSSGNYTFSGLTPSSYYGTYRVRTTALSGYTLNTPASAYDLTVTTGSTIAAENFGFVPNAALSTIASVVLDDGTAQRSNIRSVLVTINGTVTAGNIASGAFTLTQTSGTSIQSYTANVAAVTAISSTQTTVKLTFSGSGVNGIGSLADGRYTLVIDGSKIIDSNGQQLDAAGTGAAGSSRSTSFYRLAGDADGNGTVDFNDFLQLQASFGTSTGNASYNSGADTDGNGTVDFNDFLTLQAQFGKTV